MVKWLARGTGIRSPGKCAAVPGSRATAGLSVISGGSSAVPEREGQRFVDGLHTHRRERNDFPFRELELFVEIGVPDGAEVEDARNGKAGFDDWVAEALRRQMAAGGPAGEDDRPVDPVSRAVGGEPVERSVDLACDVGERGFGGQSVTRQCGGPAVRVRACDQVGELVLAVALPVATMDEDDAGGIGVGLREQVPAVAVSLAVAQIQVARVTCCGRRPGCEFARGVQHRVVGHVVSVLLYAASRSAWLRKAHRS